MQHIHHSEALEVLHAQAFTPEEMTLIEQAAAAVPWDDVAAEIDGLQNPASAEKAKDSMLEKMADLDRQHHGLAGMSVFAAAMYRTAKRMYAAGIPKKVLSATCTFLRVMTDNYRREFGYPGFDRGFWVWRQTSGIILRHGALEYEYLPSLSEYAAGLTGLTAGEPVLSIHIPSGTDLSREALDASYAQARAFYREHPAACLGGKLPQGMICHSWLLSPALKQLLGERSGIRRFADDFRICHVDENGDGYRHFLYLAGPDVPLADLPESTSLQRAVKAHLLDGGFIGEAYGVLER